MKTIKYWILAIIIIIIVTVILIFNNKKQEIDEQQEIQEVKIEEEGITEVNDRTDFFTVKTCVEQYLNEIVLNPEDENLEYIDLDYQKEIVYSLLDKDYIEEKNIEQENVLEFVNVIQRNVNLTIIDMKYLNSEKVQQYIVYAILEQEENEPIDLYVIVNIDIENSTFSITPIINSNIKNINEIELFHNKGNIEKNKYNEVIYETINQDVIIRTYFQQYKTLALYNPERLYELLDEDYKTRRFENIENFKSYIDENKEVISNIQFKQYIVNNYNDHIEWICQDEYGGIYFFEEKNILDYSIKLDSYTIPTEEFMQEYSMGNTEKKVQLNINKWILMINNQDYDNAYNVLSEEFRANYFPNKQDFINYIKENMYRYNKMEVTKFDARGNTYLCTIQLTDLTEGEYVDETKGTGGSGYTFEWNIVMQLGDNYDFVMSFEVE